MNRHAGLAIGIWLGLLLIAAWSITQARFTADLAAFLPRSPSPAQQVLVDQLRDGVVSRLILVGIEGGEPQQLAQISTRLAQQLAADDAIAYVNNGAEDQLQADGEFLIEHRYLLSDAVSPQRFTVSFLRKALEGQLDLLASPMSMVVSRVLPRDPSGELLHLFDRLQEPGGPDKRHGVWFGSQGTRALLLAQTEAPGFDIDAQQAVLERIRAGFDAAAEEAQAGDAELKITGPGVFAVASREGIKADVIRVSSIALALVALLLMLVYRSPRVLLLTLLPVASGAIAGVAAVGLVFGSVHGITLGFGATLIGEAVDYAIYLFASTVAGSTPGKALQRIWPILRLGVLTSVAGFGAMLFSGFPGLAQLGLFSLTGLIVAVAVTRWVLPSLAPAGFSVRTVDRFAPRLTAVLDVVRMLRLPLYALVVAALVWLILPGKTVWDDELASLSPVPESEQKLDESMRRDLGAPDVRQLVVVRAPDRQAALEQAEAVSAVLGSQPRRVLGGFDSPSLYLPSERMQRARQSALPGEARLRANLRQALEGLPFRGNIFEPFFADVERARKAQPMRRADLDGTGLALRVDSLLVERRGEWAAMLPLRDVADEAALAQALAGFDQTSVVLLDLKRESNAVYKSYRARVLTFALLGGSAMVILLLVALRSASRTWEVVVPLLAALVVTCAILLLGGTLNIFHLVGMLLVVGVGSNYTLFFESGEVGDEGRQRTIAALLICNLSTVIGFGALSLADTPVLQAIGRTVAIGAFLSLVFAAILTEREPV
ncbi:MAG TPA: MMPL family transporter [Burkholderiales bacterium]|nr:MMPL family transporter [Burkholderiales bacterium]